jgi:hypothetical protein
MKHLKYTEKSNINFDKYEPNNDSCCSINCCSRFNNNGICCTRDSTTGFGMGTPRCISQQLSFVSGPVSGLLPWRRLRCASLIFCSDRTIQGILCRTVHRIYHILTIKIKRQHIRRKRNHPLDSL